MAMRDLVAAQERCRVTQIGVSGPHERARYLLNSRLERVGEVAVENVDG